jgi:hypothetical protein
MLNEKTRSQERTPGGVKMEIQTQFQIYRIVEYIRQDPEFPFDTHDDPEEILNYYGIELELSGEERNLLLEEVIRIGEQAQTEEIVRFVTSDLIDQVGQLY